MKKKEYPYQNLLLKDMKGEIWKDIPDFEDYYQVSNYGRIKALERWVESASKRDRHLSEKILKQTVIKALNPFTKQSYVALRTSLCRDARQKGIAPGRMVYYCFVKKFDLADPTIVVVPKNGDSLDNRYSNLQLIPKSLVQLKTYAAGKKRRLNKTISQYNYKGILIKSYPSVKQAADYTGYNLNHISQVANGQIHHCFGWLWKFGSRKKIKPVKFPYKNVTRIAQLTLDGKLIREFFSITEAEKITGYDDMGIRDAARKRRDSYKGFVWKYLD